MCTGGFTVTSGGLKVLDSILSLNAVSLTVEGSLILDSSDIALEDDDSKVIITNTTIAGVAGGTGSVVSSALGEEAPVGSNTVVTFKPNVITGAGSILTVTGADATITVAANSALSVGGVNLDLSAQGSLVVGNGGGARVLLLGGPNPGRLTLTGSEEIYSWPGSKAFVTPNTATLSGEDVVVTTTTETGGAIGYISGGSKDDAIITTSASATFANGGANGTF